MNQDSNINNISNNASHFSSINPSKSSSSLSDTYLSSSQLLYPSSSFTSFHPTTCTTSDHNSSQTSHSQDHLSTTPSMNNQTSMASSSTTYQGSVQSSSIHRQGSQELQQLQQQQQELRESSSRCRTNSFSTPHPLSSSSTSAASSGAPLTAAIGVTTTPYDSISTHHCNELTGSHETNSSALTQHHPIINQTITDQSLSNHPSTQQQQPLGQFNNSYYQGPTFQPSGNQQQHQVTVGYNNQPSSTRHHQNHNVTWNDNIVHARNPFEYQDCSNNLYQQQQPYSYYPSDPSTDYFNMDPLAQTCDTKPPSITLTGTDQMKIPPKTKNNVTNEPGQSGRQQHQDTGSDIDRFLGPNEPDNSCHYTSGQFSNSGQSLTGSTNQMETGEEESCDGGGGGGGGGGGAGGGKKHIHSEIEKRRRDRMNNYIKELSEIIPICSGQSKKLDKLTVLRMAVQHMKMIRGNMNAFTSGSQVMPSFLTNQKLHDLIVRIAEGFLFVVSCDRGKLIFVSESVSQVLNYNQNDLVGQNIFDILHPKDIAKVKEQLTSYDLAAKERLVDAKTMLPVDIGLKNNPLSHNRMAPGARRSFFCRIKCKSVPKVKKEADTTTGSSNSGSQKKRKNSTEKKYCTIHVMGYIKNWMAGPEAHSRPGEESEREAAEDSGFNLTCLVAVGRTIPQYNPPSASTKTETIPIEEVQFVSRHAMDGKFLFVDQRAVFMLGYLPQELVGTSIYEYCHPCDVRSLADSHRAALAILDELTSAPYRFKTKSGGYICLVTKWTTFKNPWTKEFEFVVARHTCVPAPDSELTADSSEAPDGPKHGNTNTDRHGHGHTQGPTAMDVQSKLGGTSSGNSSSSEARVQKMLASDRVNLWKIGKQIAEEALRRNQQSKSSNDDSNGSSTGNFSSMGSSPLMAEASENSSKTVNSGGSMITNTDHSPNLGPSASTTGNNGNGSGSDSGGSGSQYSVFYSRSGAQESPGTGSGTSMVSSASALQVQQEKERKMSDQRGLNNNQIGIQNLNGSNRMQQPNLPQQQTQGHSYDPIMSSMSMERTPVSGSSGMSTVSSNSSQPSLADPLMIAAAAAGVSSSVSELKICDDQSYQHHTTAMSSVSCESMYQSSVDQSCAQQQQQQPMAPAGAQDGSNEDETAMALIMSILEADAGLGGPIDFSGLPW